MKIYIAFITLVVGISVAAAEPMVLQIDKGLVYIDVGSRDGVGAGSDRAMNRQRIVGQRRNVKVVVLRYLRRCVTACERGDHAVPGAGEFGPEMPPRPCRVGKSVQAHGHRTGRGTPRERMQGDVSELEGDSFRAPGNRGAGIRVVAIGAALGPRTVCGDLGHRGQSISDSTPEAST